MKQSDSNDKTVIKPNSSFIVLINAIAMSKYDKVFLDSSRRMPNNYKINAWLISDLLLVGHKLGISQTFAISSLLLR